MNLKNFEIEHCKKEIKSTKFETNTASTISAVLQDESNQNISTGLAIKTLTGHTFWVSVG